MNTIDIQTRLDLEQELTEMIVKQFEKTVLSLYSDKLIEALDEREIQTLGDFELCQKFENWNNSILIGWGWKEIIDFCAGENLESLFDFGTINEETLEIGNFNYKLVDLYAKDFVNAETDNDDYDEICDNLTSHHNLCTL
jgi:hypothetical protein